MLVSGALVFEDDIPILAQMQIDASAKDYNTPILTERRLSPLLDCDWNKARGGLARLVGQTGIAPAEDDNVMRIGNKRMPAGQLVKKRLQQRVRELKRTPAGAADGMMVRSVGAQGILRRTRAHVGFGDQFELFEQIQRAIDRDKIDVAVDLLHGSKDSLGGQVAGLRLDRCEDDGALWCDADAP